MRSALILAAILVLSSTAAADETVTHPFDTSVARSAIRRVIIDIPAADIAVRNGAADRIRVFGRSERKYDGYREEASQQRIVNDIGVAIFVNGHDALVRRSFGPNARSWSAQHWRTSYRVTVEVPRGTGIDIETSAGDVSFDGDFGNIDTDLRAGEIDLRTPRASVRDLTASVGIGEVHADFGSERDDNEGILPGSTHFFNAAGRSRIHLHTTVGELRVTLTK